MMKQMMFTPPHLLCSISGYLRVHYKKKDGSRVRVLIHFKGCLWAVRKPFQMVQMGIMLHASKQSLLIRGVALSCKQNTKLSQLVKILTVRHDKTSTDAHEWLKTVWLLQFLIPPAVHL